MSITPLLLFLKYGRTSGGGGISTSLSKLHRATMNIAYKYLLRQQFFFHFTLFCGKKKELSSFVLFWNNLRGKAGIQVSDYGNRCSDVQPKNLSRVAKVPKNGLAGIKKNKLA